MTQIQLRRGTAASWASTNPVLALGEVGYETDTLRTKIGNGTTAWNSLGYWMSGTGFVQTIGDGSATTFTVTHNLGTRNVIVSVKRSSTYAEVEVDVAATTVNAVTLTFATAPASNEFFVTVVSAAAAVTSNTVSSPIVTNSGNSLTLPTTNDTLVARNTVDTLTNKTINGANNTIQNIPTSALPFSGAQSAYVPAYQTLTSPQLTWTDLATTTDQVTVTVGASGMVLTMLSANMWNSNASQQALISLSYSGANTAAPPIGYALIRTNSTVAFQAGTTTLITGLNPGATTFKLKYMNTTTASTSTFGDRYLAVIPL